MNIYNRNFFTSESVTEGHPDKIADQISDTILDKILKQDPDARVACETFITTGLVVIGGEISTTAHINYQDLVRAKLKEIGYTRAKYGFDSETCSVLLALNTQSPDISQGVDQKSGDIGAGDQGIMFGYATNQTEDFMPITLFYAHALAKQLAFVRKQKILSYLRPDGKTQVTFEYDHKGNPIRVETIIISAQHSEEISQKQIFEDLKEYVIKKVIPSKFIDENTNFLINPTGKFVIGGPKSDAGLTGRKIIIDTYGGAACHGGGAFSGKDYTKVDRSGAYMARYIAKNIVASEIAEECQIQLSYAIGIKKPISISLETFGSEKVSKRYIVDTIYNNFDLTPKGIIETLNLKEPIYSQTSTYGHFGRNDLNLPWEKLDKINIFKKLIKTSK